MVSDRLVLFFGYPSFFIFIAIQERSFIFLFHVQRVIFFGINHMIFDLLGALNKDDEDRFD